MRKLNSRDAFLIKINKGSKSSPYISELTQNSLFNNQSLRRIHCDSNEDNYEVHGFPLLTPQKILISAKVACDKETLNK